MQKPFIRQRPISYKDFTLEKVRKQFRLAIESNQDLFTGISQPLPLTQEFTTYLNYSVPLALSINTEKARSEMVIAPILVQLKRLLNDQISLFSGKVRFTLLAAMHRSPIANFSIVFGALLRECTLQIFCRGIPLPPKSKI